MPEFPGNESKFWLGETRYDRGYGVVSRDQRPYILKSATAKKLCGLDIIASIGGSLMWLPVVTSKGLIPSGAYDALCSFTWLRVALSRT